MATAECGIGPEHTSERNSERHDKQVCSRIQNDSDCAENKELQEDMPELRGDELGNEREKEESRLGIEHFRDNALNESAARKNKCSDRQFGVPGSDHANAKPDEVSGSCVLDRVECDRGRGEDGGDPESSGNDVKQAARKCA